MIQRRSFLAAIGLMPLLQWWNKPSTTFRSAPIPIPKAAIRAVVVRSYTAGERIGVGSIVVLADNGKAYRAGSGTVVGISLTAAEPEEKVNVLDSPVYLSVKEPTYDPTT